MDTFDINGGNAETACGDSNLENALASPTSERQFFDQESKIISQESNGDFKSILVKKNHSPPTKKKLRKMKTNLGSTENIEKISFPSSPRLKRKSSDAETSSGESEEFNGFDLKDSAVSRPESIILKKLIGKYLYFI